MLSFFKKDSDDCYDEQLVARDQILRNITCELSNYLRDYFGKEFKEETIFHICESFINQTENLSHMGPTYPKVVIND